MELFGFALMFGIPILIFASPFLYLKHRKRKKFIERIEKMDFQQRQLEMMKLQAEVAKYKTSHVLHFLLCIPTFGFWMPVWFLVAISNGSQAKAIEKLMSSVTDAPVNKQVTA